ncbi:MAG TPA: hypothetical protein VKG92_09020, partial [Flavobacteriales bacterium]|nr:hypothetical protein [Flavobacteriales bacterium]
MMRSFTPVLFFAAVRLAAQPTLGDAVFPQTGATYGYHDTPYLAAGRPGEGLRWDFSNLPAGTLVPYSWTTTDIAPGAGAFPQTAFVLNVPGDATAYFQRGDTALFWLGTYSDTALVRFDPPLHMLDLPCGIHTQWVDSGLAAVSGMGRIDIRTTTFNAKADAWGSLIMPYGVVNNVLRVRYELKIMSRRYPDAIPMLEVRYAWYSDQTPMPLLVISERTGWPPPERMLRWLDGSWRDGPERLFQPIRLHAFPDPCDEIATIDLAAAKADRTVLQLVDGRGN